MEERDRPCQFDELSVGRLGRFLWPGTRFSPIVESPGKDRDPIFARRGDHETRDSIFQTGHLSHDLLD
jgi:hypothetical protein